MKRSMMFSVSVLCLAVAVLIGFHIGSQRVEAQGSEIAGYDYLITENTVTVFMSNGDVYRRPCNLVSGFSYYSQATEPVYLGNFWGSMVSSDQSTWSNIKQR